MINKKEDLYKILDIHFNKFVSEYKELGITLYYETEQVYDQTLLDVDHTKGARDIRNEFEQFKKHFVKGLYENRINIESLKGKGLAFSYDNVKVYFNY